MTKSVEPVIMYVRQMEEIKKRIDVISFFLDMKGTALYAQSTVESVALQFRKVLELIAFASLCANQKAYSKVHEDFAKHHKADILLRDLNRINPNFFPVSITSRSAIVDGVHVPELVRGALTKEEFVDVFKKCGCLLHAPNPFAGSSSIAFYQKSFPIWLSKIVLLLNTHEVHFVDDPNMWVINIKEDGDESVHYHVFELVENHN